MKNMGYILLALVTVMALNPAWGNDRAACKADYEDCKARAFADVSSCRLTYDDCKLDTSKKSSAAEAGSAGKDKDSDFAI